jgi:hypothetical protein
VPTSTDYVKDGATAIETLGDAVDASLYTINNGSNKVGLHLLNTTTFTSVSTVTIDSIFNSTYENYKIEFNMVASTPALLRIRFRDGSGDSTGTNYRYTSQQIVNTAWANLDNSNAANEFTIGYNGGARYGGTINIYNPNVSALTNYNAQSSYEQYATYAGGSINATTQFTGIKFLQSAGNVTGNIRVYGIRNS